MILGSAGCGKTFLMLTLKKLLKDSCIFLSTTGKVASNIYGQTINTFFKINTKNEPPKGIDINLIV